MASPSGGGWVLALEDGLGVTDPGSSEVRMVASVRADEPRLRFNDGKVDPAGRFFAGTMAYDEPPGAGTLYRLDADLNMHDVVAGVTISNGLGWSPDVRTMYYVDTPCAWTPSTTMRTRARSATGGR